uniref:type III PLP-dependent enzyme n=1 Tax=Herbidospora sakaeratensis TaxID=564415 RepID=UPI001C3F2C53|nr:type III PLP-dependent enzyme [Herbidospora sakaeratensis]
MPDLTLTRRVEGAMEGAAVRLRAFADRHETPSPCLLIDLPTLESTYRTMSLAFIGAEILYAVKANAAPGVITTLARLGAGFDVASLAEIELCLARGVPASRLSFSNPVKKRSDVAAAYERGVRTFAFDNPGDLRNIIVEAPGSKVFCRIQVTPPAAAMPFGAKFGCPEEAAPEMLAEAADRGLRPQGVTFHVGSQQRNLAAWDAGIAAAAKIAQMLEPEGVRLPVIDIGGGFPISYREQAATPEEFARAVDLSLARHFEPRDRPRLVIEPGRSLVGPSGMIRAEVVAVRGGVPADPRRWVFLDVGRYNGLVETENDTIAYRIHAPAGFGPDGPVVLAGPTSDGDDVLYKHTDYAMPLSLAPGDPVEVMDAGAYTSSYSCAAVNGLPALPTFCVPG